MHNLYSAEPDIISIVNPRAGTGKTTLAFELGRAFVSNKKRVLLVDLDPKSELTSIAGIKPDPQYISMAEVLLKETTIHNTLANVHEFTVAISSSNLASAETKLLQSDDYFTRLKDPLAGINPMFDLMIVDCPASLGALTQNAIVAADLILTPVLGGPDAANSMTSVDETVHSLRRHFKGGLPKSKIVRMFDDGKDQPLHDISNKYSGRILKTTVTNLSCLRQGYLKDQLEIKPVTEDIAALSKELLNELSDKSC